MAKVVDLTGQQFGRLKVIHRSAQDKWGRWTWYCRCSCGGERVIPSSSLRQGDARSCGCIHRERMVELNKTHGGSHHPLYNTWKMMLRRCYDANDTAFSGYGGRGIIVHERWRDPVNGVFQFAEDMGPRPSAKHSLERTNNELGYSPENCVWATAKQQSENRRSCILVTYNGVTKPLATWAREIGIHPSSMRGRWDRGDRGAHLLRPLSH